MQTSHDVHFRDSSSMPQLAGGSVDLVVTSPPYPMISMWDEQFIRADPAVAVALEQGKGALAYELMHRLLDRVWRECERVLKAGAYLCINIGDATRKMPGPTGGFRLYANHARVTTACEALGLESLPLILWRKATNSPTKFMGSGMLPAGAYVTLEHEYILILRKPGQRPLHEERARREWSAYFWEERNTWFSDLWNFSGERQALTRDRNSGCRASSGRILQPLLFEETEEPRERSAAFPIELPWRLIHMYSLQEDLVLDPFLGTGTTMRAAMAAGRNSIGYEREAGFAALITTATEAGVDELAALEHGRLDAHVAFIAGRENLGRGCAHFNDGLGLPVTSAQERRLRLYALQTLAGGRSIAPHGSAADRTTEARADISYLADYLPLGGRPRDRADIPPRPEYPSA